MLSEVITLYGKRYRLIPPGAYRSGSAWWVDWRDDAGKRRRMSSYTADLEEAKRFAYNVASGMNRRDARSQIGYLPARPIVAREIARSDAEAKLIGAWLPPNGERTVRLPAEVIGEAVAGMPPKVAIRLLRRIIRRIQADATRRD